MTKRFVYPVLFVVALISLPALLTAQAPHGGAGTKLQPGPNVNAAGGIVNPGDPAALVKSDVLLQRQNETVVAASTRNPDHLIAAANDYRFVDFPDDPQFGGGQNFIARLIAKLLGRPTGKRLPPAAAAANVGPWTGVYRSCDRGRTWIGSALPGSPLDNSPAAQLPNPLKQLSLEAMAAPQGGHAETTDPVLKAGPGGRMHMVVLGFVRYPDNSVGASRMFYASYTDRNNVEGGSCFNFDFIRQIDSSTAYVGAGSPNPFIDKPSIAVDKDGMIVVSYTLFTDSVKSKIVIARSADGGATWTKTMPILSLGFLRNHGTSTTIDPVNGTVYVAWRLFYQDWPLMVVSRSFDRGRTFLPATPISHWWPTLNIDQIVAQLKAAKLRPFDQFNETPGGDPSKSTARSLAFPSIVAGTVNGQSRLYAVWQERAQIDATPAQGTPAFGLPFSNGSPRVMFTMSSDGGWSWTPRRAIDAGARVEHPLLPGYAEPPETRPSGPQVQPMLSISGLNNPQLLVLYYEAREELATPYGSNFISGIARQMDVRAARINPVTGQLVAPSVQVAQYAIKANSSPVALAETAPGYDAVSRSNLWMYGGGTKAFFGDYPFLAPSVEFEFDTGSRWKWSSEPASALAIWTDHRDVQFPPTGIEGAWNAYTPVTNATSCSFVALRNANPYFTEIAGVVAGSPQNFKPLNIQRSFVTYVENRTGQDRRFRLTLSGSPASFDQFAGSPAVDVQVFGNSSHTQTIWVAPNPGRPTASVRMAVVEIDTNGAVVAGGYRTSVTLNPDPNNDALTPIPSTAPVPPGTDTGINSSELHNPQVSAPQVSAFNIRAPQVSAPQVSAPQVSAPQVSAPQVSAPQVSAPQVSAPQVSAATPGDGNEGTDVTYTVTNTGNTESTYNALLNVPGVQGMLNGGYYDFQVLITRTSLVPGFLPTAGSCLPAAENKVQVIANLQIPDASAAQFLAISGASSQLATFSVAPAGGADVAAISADGQSTIPRDEVKVTLRAIRLQPLASIPAEFVFDPAEVVLTVAAESTNVLNGVVQPDGTQPVVTATTTTLALATSPLGGAGDPVTLIATVSPAPPNAAQAMVQFFNGDAFLGAAPTDDGEASLTLENLPFAIRSFTARFTGTPTLAPSTSGVITQHVIQRLGDLEAFDAAVAGLSIATQDFNAFAAGTPISQLNPIGGMLNFTSSFETLQVWTDSTAFGLNGGVRQNGRYDLFFLQPGAALAFDIAAQDPATSAAAIEVVTSAGSVFFTAVNPGVETANVFHGFIGTLPILGVRVYEGCETGQPVVPGCLNEEISIDNLRIVGRDVRLWSIDGGGNGHYYEYVRQGGLSWTEANAAAQARSYLGQPGRLVSITSAAENAFVDSLRDEGTLRAWIGLRDPDGIGAGSWAWTTGEPTSYFNWAALEPNNPSTEFWVEIFAGGAWNNNTVRDLAFPTLGYVVEYDPPSGEIGFMTPPLKGSANGSEH